MNPAKSLAWSIWQRNARWLIALASIMVLFCFSASILGGEREHPTLFVIMSMLLFFSYLGLMGIFMYQDSDVGVKGSAYPSHMITLPVRTYQLVLLPLLLGSAVLLGSGFVISLFIHSTYRDFPLYWPAMTLAAGYLMLAAIFWYPFGIPYSKLVLTLAGVVALPVAIGHTLENHGTELGICLGLAVFMAVCLAMAYHGVVRARRGEVQLFWWQSIEAKPIGKKKFKWLSFRDAFQAQRWYEWRQQGIILPSLALALCIAFALPLLGGFFNAFVTLNSNSNSIVYELGRDKDGFMLMASPYVYTYIRLFIWLIPVTAWVVGCGARRNEVKNTDRSFYLFFGTRPMSDGALIAQKLWAALRSTVFSWIIVLFFFLLFFLQMGGKWDPSQQMIISQQSQLLPMLLERLNPGVAFNIAIAFSLLVFITWRNYAIGFWTEMSGQKWLRYGYPIGLLMVVFGLPPIWSMYAHTGMFQDTFVLKATVYGVWAIVLIRLGLTAYLITKQLKSKILTSQTLIRGLVMHGVGLGLLFTLVFPLTSFLREVYVSNEICTQTTANLMVAGLFLLWTPIVRILLATEMLHQNRHRAR